MRYWLGLGSNLGDRGDALRSALAALDGEAVTIEAVSAIYETAPQEVTDQPPFLNAGCRVHTELAPDALLAFVKRLEQELGRRAGPRYGPRAIDIDVLLWEGGAWRSEHLEVPHPRLAERRFALVPVLEIDPLLRLPDGRALAEIAAGLDSEQQPVRRVDRFA